MCWSLWLVVVLVSEKTRDAVCNEGIGEGEERDGWHSCESGKSQLGDVRVAWVLRLRYATDTDGKDYTGLPTSLTTVLWSLRSGLGTQFFEPGGGFGGRRGGLEVRYAKTSTLVKTAD